MSFCEIHLTAFSESCWECEKIPTREEFEKLIETQKNVIAHMTKKQHEADAVIAFYAKEDNWDKSINRGNNYSVEAFDCVIHGNDNEASGNYVVGGKRAREYQKKYSEDK